MPAKWFIIINPTAGGGRGKKKWKQVQQALTHLQFSFKFALTTHPQHAMALAEGAVLDGYRFIAAVGGDGTAHEVVNGICRQTQIPSEEVVFALLPVGTGNDWIKTHHIPNDYRQVIELMRTERTMLHDIGIIHYQDPQGQPTSRYFLNVAGLGYDAFVTKASNEKRRWGSNKLTYLYLILSSVLRYRTTQMRLTIDIDKEVVEGMFYSVAIGQGRYNGGGAQFVPQAIPNDGLFALTAFRDIAIWEVVLNTPRFYNGTIISHPKAVIRQATSLCIEALGDSPTLLEADGEYLGHTPAQFDMRAAALQVIVP